MRFLSFYLIFSFLYSTVMVVDSFRYLAVLHTVAKSHFIYGESLLKALAKKGHEVFVISPYQQERPVRNYYDIPFKIGLGTKKNLFDRLNENAFLSMFKWYRYGLKLSEHVLRDRNVQELMALNMTFDAVICEVFLSESLFGLSEHFNAPLIGLSMQGAILWDTDMVGSPSPPSYVPSHLTRLTDHMSTIQRSISLFLVIAEKVIMELYYLRRQAALYDKYFPNSTRDMYTVRENAALVLLNSHTSYTYPRPYMPNHVEVGGMHISRERMRLPRNIQKFIQGAEHGVVYFSMGSSLKSVDMPHEKKQIFLEAFANITQRVLWKYEDPTLEGKPDNVLISNWFPQNDILAHENVKIFITHGGLMGTTESIYHATPMIGIPIRGEEHINMLVAVNHGFAVRLHFDALTAQELVDAINLLINNRTYAQRVKEVSARYKSQPMSPMDLAVYWVEYIARHKGAKYLHCAGLDLNFFQYHNLDVYAAVTCAVVMFFWIQKLLLKL